MQFKSVIGQETYKRHLIKEVNAGKLSHAQLFLGKTGFGGLPLALAFVQYLFCTNKSENDSCGACASCKKVIRLQHPDVHFSFPTVQAITKTSDPSFKEWSDAVLQNPYLNLNEWISISDEKGRKPIISRHQSQEIVKKLSLKSFEGNYKVSIIWMADEMNQVCANKLLKIIEEPPQKTLFLLIAENQDKLMPTILSRTQLLAIKPIDDSALNNFIRQHGQFSQGLIESVIARSDGNVQTALQLLSNSRDHNQNRTDFVQLMRVCYKKEVLSMLDWAEKLASYGREEQKSFLVYALYMVRQSLMKNFTAGELLRASDEEIAFLQNFSRFISGNNVIEFVRLFNDAHYHVDRNAHAKMLFTNITFEVMRYIHKA
jgi:DNA polymerase-3 subunit delta'